MFELEDYSTGGFHDGYLNKFPESSAPTLDFYISDSLQDMLDVDIRSEIANVVGSSNELASLVTDLPSSFDHAIDAISSFNNTASAGSTCSSNNSYLHSSAWLSGPTWSSSNDFYADVGACVNPISVMPMLSSSLLLRSPKTNLNVNGLSSATSPPPPSPTDIKSHLTFSPALYSKKNTNALRSNEQSTSTTTSIPKQIVAISSTVTNATTAPATMATNSALQRKSTAIDGIKKDLSLEMSKAMTTTSGGGGANNAVANSTTSGTNTIKLAPGIGGLTFANSITYNKLKQQSAAKTTVASTPLTTNGTIMLKRERDSSPLHNANNINSSSNGAAVLSGYLNGQHVTKILARNVVHANANFTPKSIASAQSPLLQNNSNSGGNNSSLGSPSSSSSSSNGSSGFGAGRLTPISANDRLTPIGSGGRSTPNIIAGRPIENIVKPLLQKNSHQDHPGKEFPKPAYSYSCLIAMALKNSRAGSLPVSEIYSFMCEHFPYFKTAPSGWKNSVRHNLSLNKCFEKIEKPATNGNQRKGCLWAMNPDRITKMDEEVQKWSRKDPLAIRKAMVFPDHLEALERGEMKHGSTNDSDLDLDSQSEIEETSDSDQEHELVDDTIVDSMFVEEDIEEVTEDEIGILDNNQHQIIVGDRNEVEEASDEEGCGVEAERHQRDFDIEVEDIYDAIDLEDDKEAVRLAINQSDIIEMGTSDIINAHDAVVGYQSPKRARLNVSYSIRPAGDETEKQHNLLTHTNHFKQAKVLQSHQQQHIVIQTLPQRGSSSQQQQQFNTIPSHSRRKMQLINRIA